MPLFYLLSVYFLICKDNLIVEVFYYDFDKIEVLAFMKL